MNSFRKSLIAASAVIPALTMFGSAAFADGGAEQAIQYNNLVQNGTFLTNANGWTAGNHTTVKAVAGKGQVANTTNVAAITTEAIATQCVPFELGASPDFKGKILIPGSQVRKGSAKYRLTFFKNSDCTTFAGSVDLQTVTQTGTTKSFNYEPDAWMAGNARSVKIQLVVEKQAGKIKDRDENFVAFFDDVKLLVVKASEPAGPPAVACFGECGGPDDGGPLDDGPVCSLGCEEDEAEDVPPVIEVPPTVEDEPVVADDETPEVIDEPVTDDGETLSEDDGPASDDDSDSEGGPVSPSDSAEGDDGTDGTGTTAEGDGASNDGAATDDPKDSDQGAKDKPESDSNNEELVSGGASEKTPLAPSTGSDSTQDSEGSSNNFALFGLAGGAMAGLGLAIVALIRRRKDADVR